MQAKDSTQKALYIEKKSSHETYPRTPGSGIWDEKLEHPAHATIVCRSATIHSKLARKVVLPPPARRRAGTDPPPGELRITSHAGAVRQHYETTVAGAHTTNRRTSKLPTTCFEEWPHRRDTRKHIRFGELGGRNPRARRITKIQRACSMKLPPTSAPLGQLAWKRGGFEASNH